jgi:hypothetical protein
LENLALRQQLLALHTQRPRRRLTAWHKLFWVVLRRLWTRWKEPLILVTPRSVVNWHRAGFRLYWNWLSRARQMGGRRPVSQEIRALMKRADLDDFAACYRPETVTSGRNPSVSSRSPADRHPRRFDTELC